MFLKRNVLFLFLSLFFIISIGHGADDILLNGTSIYLANGISYVLPQGYILSLKGVSSDGSIWLQLMEKDNIVKSEIVYESGYFIYSKTNRTILSGKIDKIYSGSSEQSLVLISLYQFIDPDIPVPNQTEITIANSRNSINNSSFPRTLPAREYIIWAMGMVFIIILFYVLRKLW